MFIFAVYKNKETMTAAQINTEIENTKNVMTSMMNCIKEGKTELYKDYIAASTYYLQLLQMKPSHNLKLA